MKIACLVHECLNGTKIFGRQRKLERWWLPRPSMHSCYRRQHWKSARCDSKDRRLGVRAAAEEVNLDWESVRRILRKELNLRKVCAKMVPKVLSNEHKGTVFRPFVTHWKWTRFVEYDNYLWWNLDIYVWSRNQATINAVEVNIISKTKKSTHKSFVVQGHVVLFDIQGIMMAEWIPSGQMVNQQYYIEALT